MSRIVGVSFLIVGWTKAEARSWLKRHGLLVGDSRIEPFLIRSGAWMLFMLRRGLVPSDPVRICPIGHELVVISVEDGVPVIL